MRSLSEYIIEKFAAPNNGDEFYTRLKDIEKCCQDFNFSGKVIYCNCDDPSFSNFWKYFHDNFSKLRLKKLMATYYSDDPYLYEYDGKDINKTKIDSGRFQDNEKYLDKCDFVVSNPPYSGNMPLEYIKLLLKHNVDFLFVGPTHLIKKKEFFDLYKNGKVYSCLHYVHKFERPGGGKDQNAPTTWWTSIKQDKPDLKFEKEYSEDKYNKYENYDAIDCTPYTEIPKDYDGLIGIPYTSIYKLSERQFKLIDILNVPILNDKKIMSRLIIKFT